MESHDERITMYKILFSVSHLDKAVNGISNSLMAHLLNKG